MKLRNFSPWGWIALLLIYPAYNGEAFAQQGGYGGYHMGSGMMGEWGMGWFGGIFMIIFLFFISFPFVLKLKGLKPPFLDKEKVAGLA